MPKRHNETRLRARLLVFDLDGTLIDSRRDLANSVNATLNHLSREPMPGDQIASFIGDGATALVQRSLDATGGSDDGLLARAMPFFLAYYREHKLDHTYAYDGVLSSLHAIRDALPHLPMAVLTNKPVRPSREICEAVHLAPFFFQIYGGDSFATKKPNPEGLLQLTQEAEVQLGTSIAPEHVVLIGDSDVDVNTARSAGAKSLGCSYGFAPDALTAAKPDAMVHSPAEWISALDFAGTPSNGIL